MSYINTTFLNFDVDLSTNTLQSSLIVTYIYKIIFRKSKDIIFCVTIFVIIFETIDIYSIFIIFLQQILNDRLLLIITS